MDKRALRKYFLDIRSGLSQSFVKEASQMITHNLFAFNEFRSAQIIHCYSSIPDNREVDTAQILQHCTDSGKQLIMPKVLPNGELNHVLIEPATVFKTNKWGVAEPQDGKLIQPDVPDLIIVPMVAGDRMKNRLGYGKGYYDRFLSKSVGLKVGILFDCQLYKSSLPIESFDIPLDLLITENEIIG